MKEVSKSYVIKFCIILITILAIYSQVLTVRAQEYDFSQEITGIAPEQLPGQVKNDGGGDKSQVMSEMIKDLQNAKTNDSWTAPFVQAYTSIGESYAKKIFQTFASEIVPIISYIFGIYIFVIVVKMFMGWTPGTEALNNLSMVSFAFIVSISMLSASNLDLYWTIFMSGPVSIVTKISLWMMSLGGVKLNCTANGNISADLACLSAGIESNLKFGFSVGWIIVKMTKISIMAPSLIASAIAQVLAGLFVMVSYAFAIVMFTFMLAELFTTAAFVTGFGAFWIGLAVIPKTRNYAKSAMGILLGLYASVIGSAFVIGLFGAVLKASTGAISSMVTTVVEGSALQTNNGSITSSAGFWMLILISLGVASLTRKISKEASQLFGGSGAASDMIGGRSVSLVSKGLQGAATAVAATAGAGFAASKLAISTHRNKQANSINHINSKEGENENG